MRMVYRCRPPAKSLGMIKSWAYLTFSLLADSNVAGRILLFKLLQKFKQISIFDIFDCQPFCCPTQLSHVCKTFKWKKTANFNLLHFFRSRRPIRGSWQTGEGPEVWRRRRRLGGVWHSCCPEETSSSSSSTSSSTKTSTSVRIEGNTSSTSGLRLGH